MPGPTSSQRSNAADSESALTQCLFLMGAHRSGTTWLHQLLASTPEATHITLWDIIRHQQINKNPTSRKEAEAILQSQGINRGFDNIEVGLEMPEEYGWILDKDPFDFYATRPISNTSFEPLRALINEKINAGEKTSWLLLKNPVDFYDGFLEMDQQFPKSHFLFLHRHPLAVYRSQVKAWQQLFDEQNHYLAMISPKYASIMSNPALKRQRKMSLCSQRALETMLSTLADSFEFHVKNENKMKAKTMRIRYEDLCANPEKVLNLISTWMQLKQPLKTPEKLSARARILNEDPMILATYKKHHKRFESYCDWLGYNVEEENA